MRTHKGRKSRSRDRKIRIAGASVIVLGLVAAGGAVAAKKLLPDPTIDAVKAAAERIEEIPGDDPAIIITPKDPSKGIVLYVHGNKQTEREVLSGTNVAPVVAKLVESGYTVVSSFANGNAWGNRTSLSTYLQIVYYVQSITDVDDVFLMGESMGGLASLQLAEAIPEAKAWIGFYPVCDTRTLMGQEDLRQGIEAAYPGGDRMEAVSPVAIPKDIPLMFFASPDDTRVPKESNTDVCAAESPWATVTTTEGNHGHPSNFPTEKIVQFFDTY